MSLTVNGFSLQPYCNKEGFNVECSMSGRKSRIDILGNERNDCDVCGSVIGFGIEIDCETVRYVRIVEWERPR